tara:strand:- start:306 stop:542 length:237 start_codon:yes stop_codon:yes gene_type:complete
MGRRTKAEEYNLINKMEMALPTDKVLEEFAALITDGHLDERVRLAAVVKWMEWRVGKPKTMGETEYEVNVPKIELKFK